MAGWGTGGFVSNAKPNAYEQQRQKSVAGIANALGPGGAQVQPTVPTVATSQGNPGLTTIDPYANTTTTGAPPPPATTTTAAPPPTVTAAPPPVVTPAVTAPTYHGVLNRPEHLAAPTADATGGAGLQGRGVPSGFTLPPPSAPTAAPEPGISFESQPAWLPQDWQTQGPTQTGSDMYGRNVAPQQYSTVQQLMNFLNAKMIGNG